MPYLDGKYHTPQGWENMEYGSNWYGNMADLMEATRSALLERMAVAYGVTLPNNSYYNHHLADLKAKMEGLKNFQICGGMIFDFIQVVDICMDALMTCFNEMYTAPVNIGKPYYHGSNTDSLNSPRGFFLIPTQPCIAYQDGVEYYLAYNFITPTWMFSDTSRNWKIPLQECTPGCIPTKFVEVFRKVRNALDVMYKVPCEIWYYMLVYAMDGYGTWDLQDGIDYVTEEYEDAISQFPTNYPSKSDIRGIARQKFTAIYTAGSVTRLRYSLTVRAQEIKIRGIVNAFPDCDIDLRFGTVYRGIIGYSNYNKEYTGPTPEGQLGDYDVGYVTGPYHLFGTSEAEYLEFPADFGTLDWPNASTTPGEGNLKGYYYRLAPYADFKGCFKFTANDNNQ